jgi:peptidoglycan/LPS O-acetylase OafA/YrhL
MQDSERPGAPIVARGRATVARPDSATALPAALTTGLVASHLPGLDGLRAIAAFLVVFGHAGLGAPDGLGVLMFFVLSGFLITWLLLKEYDQYETVSLRMFYWRRALRIFPAFYAYWALITAIYLVRDTPVNWPQALSSFFYVNNYYQAFNGDPNSGYSHTWSLGVEEQFYLLWPMLFVSFAKNLRRMARFLAGTIVVIWIYRTVLLFAFGVWHGYAYEAFDMRADHLAVGCLMAVSVRTGMAPKMWRALCWRPPMALLTAALLVASSTAEARYGSAFRDGIGFIVNPLLTAALIGQVIAFQADAMWNWLNSSVVRYLGTISYSVYLYQQLLVHPALSALKSQHTLVQAVGVMVVVIIAASCSYFLIERPFLKLKTRFLRVGTP